MNVIHLIWDELKAIVTSPRNMIYMGAVLFIPLLYAGLFLYAFWDAYERTGNLPVAVVNQDQGAKIAGETLNAGDELVKELKKDDHFDWTFVDEDKADDGFKNNEYFMVVKIPENFSRNATTLTDQKVKSSSIDYKLNADYNYVASKMANTGLNELKQQVTGQITKTYAETMYDQLDRLASGLQDASEGAGDLSKGTKEELDGLNQLKSGFKDLLDGSGQLEKGSGKLADGADSLNAGLKQASDGTGQLYRQTSESSGNVAKLADGANQLADSLDELNRGVAQLSDGSGALSGGSRELNEKMNQYLQGMQQFQEGLTKEADGLEQLNKKVSASKAQIDALSGGIAKLSGGADDLSAGIQQLAPVSKQVSDGVNQFAALPELPDPADVQRLKERSQKFNTDINKALNEQDGKTVTVPRELLEQESAMNDAIQGINVPNVNKNDLNQLQEGAAALSQAFNQGINGRPSLVEGSESLASGLSALDGKVNAVDPETGKPAGLSEQFGELSSAVTQLSGGMDKIQGGEQSLQDNFRKLTDGQQRLEQGMATLQTNLGKLPDATGALGEGAGQLADGNDQLNETWPKLVSGIQTLQNGTDQLVSGSGRLASNMNAFSQGISDLTDGQRRLADGTDQLTDGAGQLADGSETLKSGLADAHDEVGKTPTTDAHAKQFSQPVTAIDSSHQTVDTFGSGFAPYFISLGFFIGALILTIVYDLGRPAGPATTGIGIAVSKLFIAFLMSLGQMLILDTVVLIGLDLQVDNVWVFLGFSLLVSMTFMTLITFLAGTFDNVGRFIALVILILQLVTCGGAYAIQLIPDLIQPLATVLPMTYSVNGFRNIIDGSQQNLLNVNASVLAGFLVLHLMLTMIAFTVKFRINRRAAQAVRPTAESSVSQ